MNAINGIGNGTAFPTVKALARALASHGRNGDTDLAVVTRSQMRFLKALGGSGTTNPVTGLPEFWDISGLGDYSYTPEPSNYVETAAPAPSPAPREDFNFTEAGTGNPAPSPDPTNYGDTFGYPGSPTGPALSSNPAPDAGSPPAYGGPDSSRGNNPNGPGAPTPGVNTNAAGGVDAAAPKQTNNWLSALNNPDTLAKLGVTAYGALKQRTQLRRAQQQADGVQNQHQALADPYKAQAAKLNAQVDAGQLTSQQQQAIDAFKAQARQQMTNAGQSVGSAATQQIERQAEEMKQNFLQNLHDQALQLMQVGDQYAQAGITAGYAANKDLQASTQTFYSNLANMVSNALGTKPAAQPAAKPAGTP